MDYNEEEIIVLGEEYSDELLRGRIAKLVVDRKTYKLKSWKIILDLPTHLSFPRVVRKNGEIFIHPENSQSAVTRCIVMIARKTLWWMVRLLQILL